MQLLHALPNTSYLALQLRNKGCAQDACIVTNCLSGRAIATSWRRRSVLLSLQEYAYPRTGEGLVTLLLNLSVPEGRDPLHLACRRRRRMRIIIYLCQLHRVVRERERESITPIQPHKADRNTRFWNPGHSGEPHHPPRCAAASCPPCHVRPRPRPRCLPAGIFGFAHRGTPAGTGTSRGTHWLSWHAPVAAAHGDET